MHGFHTVLGQRFAQRVNVELESCLLPSPLCPRFAPSAAIDDDLSGMRGQRGICHSGVDFGLQNLNPTSRPRHARVPSIT